MQQARHNRRCRRACGDAVEPVTVLPEAKLRRGSQSYPPAQSFQGRSGPRMRSRQSPSRFTTLFGRIVLAWSPPLSAGPTTKCTNPVLSRHGVHNPRRSAERVFCGCAIDLINTVDADGVSLSVKGVAADGAAISQESTFKYDGKAYAMKGAADYDRFISCTQRRTRTRRISHCSTVEGRTDAVRAWRRSTTSRAPGLIRDESRRKVDTVNALSTP
jgi:hypothetical protein